MTMKMRPPHRRSTAPSATLATLSSHCAASQLPESGAPGQHSESKRGSLPHRSATARAATGSESQIGSFSGTPQGPAAAPKPPVDRRWRQQQATVSSALDEIRLLRQQNERLKSKVEKRANAVQVEKELHRQRPSTSDGRCGSPPPAPVITASPAHRRPSQPQNQPNLPTRPSSAQGRETNKSKSPSPKTVPAISAFPAMGHAGDTSDSSGAGFVERLRHAPGRQRRGSHFRAGQVREKGRIRRIRSDVPRSHTSETFGQKGAARAAGFDPNNAAFVRRVRRRRIGAKDGDTDDDDEEGVVVEVTSSDSPSLDFSSKATFESGENESNTAQSSKMTTIVDISDRQIGLKEVRQLLPRLRRTGYSELHVNDNNINSLACELLLQNLNPKCRVLDLGGNAIGTSGVLALSRQVLGAPVHKFGQIVTLSLRGTGLNDIGLIGLCDGLHYARQLQRLNLSHNYITATGLDALVEAMVADESLSDSSNGSGSDSDGNEGVRGGQSHPSAPGAPHSSSKSHNRPRRHLHKRRHAHSKWRALWDLNLGFNKCGVSVVPLLTAGARFPELLDLNIAGNGLGAAFASAPFAFEGFLAGLASNHCLQHLDLTKNSFTDRDTRRLAAALTNNTTLLGLHLDASLRGYVDTCGALLTPKPHSDSTKLHLNPNPEHTNTNTPSKLASNAGSVARSGQKPRSHRRSTSDTILEASVTALAEQLPGDHDLFLMMHSNIPNLQLTHDIRRHLRSEFPHSDVRSPTSASAAEKWVNRGRPLVCRGISIPSSTDFACHDRVQELTRDVPARSQADALDNARQVHEVASDDASIINAAAANCWVCGGWAPKTIEVRVHHTAPVYALLLMPHSPAVASLHLSCDYFRGFPMHLRLAARGEFDDEGAESDVTIGDQRHDPARDIYHHLHDKPRDIVLTLTRTLPPGDHYFFVSVFDGSAPFLEPASNAGGVASSNKRSSFGSVSHKLNRSEGITLDDAVKVAAAAANANAGTEVTETSVSTPRSSFQTDTVGESFRPRRRISSTMSKGLFADLTVQRKIRQRQEAEAREAAEKKQAEEEAANRKAADTGPFWILHDIVGYSRVPWKSACTSHKVMEYINQQLQAHAVALLLSAVPDMPSQSSSRPQHHPRGTRRSNARAGSSFHTPRGTPRSTPRGTSRRHQSMSNRLGAGASVSEKIGPGVKFSRQKHSVAQTQRSPSSFSMTSAASAAQAVSSKPNRPLSPKSLKAAAFMKRAKHHHRISSIRGLGRASLAVASIKTTVARAKATAAHLTMPVELHVLRAGRRPPEKPLKCVDQTSLPRTLGTDPVVGGPSSPSKVLLRRTGSTLSMSTTHTTVSVATSRTGATGTETAIGRLGTVVSGQLYTGAKSKWTLARSAFASRRTVSDTRDFFVTNKMLLRMLQADVQFSKSQMLLMDVFFAQLFHQQKQERANSESGFSLSDSPQETSKDQKADSALLAGQDGLYSFSPRTMSRYFSRYEALENSLLTFLTPRYRFIYCLFQMTAIWFSDVDDAPFHVGHNALLKLFKMLNVTGRRFLRVRTRLDMRLYAIEAHPISDDTLLQVLATANIEQQEATSTVETEECLNEKPDMDSGIMFIDNQAVVDAAKGGVGGDGDLSAVCKSIRSPRRGSLRRRRSTRRDGVTSPHRELLAPSGPPQLLVHGQALARQRLERLLQEKARRAVEAGVDDTVGDVHVQAEHIAAGAALHMAHNRRSSATSLLSQVNAENDDQATNRFEWLEIILRVVLLRFAGCHIDPSLVPSENHNLWVCGVTFDEGHSSPPVTKKKSQPPSTSANAISVKGGPPKAVIKSKFVGSSADPCLPMQHGACVTLETGLDLFLAEVKMSLESLPAGVRIEDPDDFRRDTLYTAKTDYFFHFCSSELRVVYNEASHLPPGSSAAYAMTYAHWMTFVTTRSDKLVPQIISPVQVKAAFTLSLMPSVFLTSAKKATGLDYPDFLEALARLAMAVYDVLGPSAASIGCASRIAQMIVDFFPRLVSRPRCKNRRHGFAASKDNADDAEKRRRSTDTGERTRAEDSTPSTKPEAASLHDAFAASKTAVPVKANSKPGWPTRGTNPQMKSRKARKFNRPIKHRGNECTATPTSSKQRGTAAESAGSHPNKKSTQPGVRAKSKSQRLSQEGGLTARCRAYLQQRH